MDPSMSSSPAPQVVQATRWTKHGDHPAVEPYGPSLLDQYPAYEQCGVVAFDYRYHHVAPGFWVLTMSDGTHRVARPEQVEPLLSTLVQ